MEKKLFTLLLSVIFTSNLLANPTDTRKMIELKVKQEHRSVSVPPAIAFITGSFLEINFNCFYREAIISIYNNYTGEEVYHEKVTDESVVTMSLHELTANNVEYSLYILIGKNTIVNGEFTIE